PPLLHHVPASNRAATTHGRSPPCPEEESSRPSPRGAETSPQRHPKARLQPPLSRRPRPRILLAGISSRRRLFQARLRSRRSPLRESRIPFAPHRLHRNLLSRGPRRSHPRIHCRLGRQSRRAPLVQRTLRT